MPTESLLFALYTADMEKELKKEEIGVVVIGDTKIWTLAYVDNLVILATYKENLEAIMKKNFKDLRNM